MLIIPLVLNKILDRRSFRSDKIFLKQINEVIFQNLCSDALTVSSLCREIGISGSHLRRKMHAATGLSPIQYMRSVRLREAARLIRRKQLNVSEAAYQVGFSSMSYFAKCFKNEFGILPSIY